MTLYKVLDKDGCSVHGGNAQWSLPHGEQPGEWMPPIDDLKMCESGYHLVEADSLSQWLVANCRIFEAESGGGRETKPLDGKHCCHSARLPREMAWNDRIARLFACDCAERALTHDTGPDQRSVNAIAVARKFANGEATDDELAAARDAAWAAACAAARDAEVKWQGHRIEMYLCGEIG